MAHTDREAELYFSQPFRQIILMLLALGLAGFVTMLALPRVLPVFEANPYLNGFIVFVFGMGVLATFWQIYQMMRSVRWIEAFASDRAEREGVVPPSLLTPLANLLGTRARGRQISSGSARSILDSVAQRIDEEREITRYIVSLLIFLGLLGTFYGLATTVPALVDTIRGLAPAEGESGVEVFARLMSGLDAQLSGMGVAFASSLLGLAGSLVVGLLELFAGHAQNRFYRELEEWLSSITRLGFSSGEGEDGGQAAVLDGVLEHMTEQMSGQMQDLQQMFADSDVSRAVVDQKLGSLTDSIERLTFRLGDQNPTVSALTRVAEGQEALIGELRQRGASSTDAGIDAESRMRLRSIDVQMLRVLEEISAGRQEMMAELRTDLNALAKVLREQRGGSPRPVRAAGKTVEDKASDDTESEG
ncbi:biopolymer transporter ExbB [Lentibacter sp. XHP0401]|uniref:biopolymer transporter ExbB n=1 Tax=Lentibacter sp. XHP0401 TaxID=2984334 RepID=UPI0021E87D68|nr:biopolymer transporter ExbB [Lentibacter sp. XHP0401]MCV2893068.1 biopolymer transporter ExbB [Lentibacter sp. XHP0401]